MADVLSKRLRFACEIRARLPPWVPVPATRPCLQNQLRSRLLCSTGYLHAWLAQSPG